MAKISGSYQSLLRGVSQQPPEQRLPGQHSAQVNMMSDPVAGVTRRPGTQRVAESSALSLDAADLSTNFETTPIKVGDKEFTIHTRRPGSPGATVFTPNIVFLPRGHGDDGQAYAPTVTFNANTAMHNGINAVAVVGDYLVIATTQPVTVTRTEKLETPFNRRRAHVQVRGGAYSRKFTIKFKLVSGAEILAEYTTPASAYGGTLDTSGISASDPAYTKKVNDLVNAYNSEVTKWIGTAAAAIQPQAIAVQLGTAFLANGGTAQGVTVGVENGTLAITAPSDIQYLEVQDGGDGSLLKGTWQEVPAAEDLPPYAFAGKVVRVAPRDSDVYYMEAHSDKGGFSQVVWKECSAEAVAFQDLFCLGLYYDDGWYVGSSPDDLATALGLAGHEDVPVPEFGVRQAGDDDTNPEPHFVGREITYLGVFQDRLLVGSDNVINASLIGGYFSFFRTTVLSAPDDDPVEMFATGTEGDVLRRGVIFDKSLILFGKSAQYAIPGAVPLTPATANIMQSSRHIGAVDIAPLALGNLVFYARTGGSYSSLHQINVGTVADTSNSSDVSAQLDTFLPGRLGSMVGLSSPNCVVMHMTDAPHSIFVYRYIDAQDGARLLDSWARWDFSPLCGTVVGVSQYNDRLRIHFVREVDIDGFVYDALSVDEVSLAAEPPTLPCLDSMRPIAGDVLGRAGAHVAYGGNVAEARRWQGARTNDPAALVADVGYEDGLMEGFPFPAYFTPTSPVRRDQNDAPITTGALVVDSLAVVFRDTGGFTADVTTDWETYEAARYIGRRLGALDNLVGQRSLHRGTEVIPIGQNTSEYAATIRAIDWHPLSVTSIDWVGQYFNRTRRA